MKVLIAHVDSDATNIEAMLLARGIEAQVILIENNNCPAMLERAIEKIAIHPLPHIENPCFIDDNKQWWKKFDKKRKK